MDCGQVAIVGGGPGGLFLARLLRRQSARTRVVVYERNPPEATFGFGVVFSERTLSALCQADQEIHDQIVGASRQWTDMELRIGGRVVRYGGFGFTAIARKTLLRLLQEGAERVGAELQFETEVELDEVASSEVVVASDGANSSIRRSLARELGASEELGSAKYAWFGTTARFDRVTFPFVETEHGPFAAHAYPYDGERSTFIVEVDEDTWGRAGMREWTAAAQAPGDSDTRSSSYLERAFADHLDGCPLLVNNSKWANFRLINNASWHQGNVVLIGDAAHTAHFSVGSGTKLAMEDSIALARALSLHARTEDAYVAYERERRPLVARTQNWARPSQRWWETFGRRRFQSAEQFAFHFITRTGALSYRGLLRRDSDAVASAERQLVASELPSDAGSAVASELDIGGRIAPNRLALPLAELGSRGASKAEVLSFAHSGVGMVIAPVKAAVESVRESRQGAALVCAQVNSSNPEASAAAVEAGVDLVEVVDVESRDLARFMSPDQERLVVAMHVSLCDPWGAEADRLIRRAGDLMQEGALGVRLIPDIAGLDRERELRSHPALPGVGLADRIRTETGGLVALTVAAGWGLGAPLAHGDDWMTQAHLALVAGRVDMLATWPFHLDGRGAQAPVTDARVDTAGARSVVR